MGLSLSEIQELVKNPKARTQLQRAQQDNDWISFHAKAVTNRLDATPYQYFFEAYIHSILIPRKARTFFNLLRFPLPSTLLLEEVIDEMNICFEAADKHVDFEMSDELLEEQAEEVLKASKFESFIRNDLFQAWFMFPNSVVITDLPETQTTEIAEPYRFILQAGQIWDMKQNRDGKVEYLGFFVDEKREKFAFIDDVAYMMFTISNGNLMLDAMKPHGLGYCPAVFCSQDIYSPSEPLRRNNPVLSSLSVLDDYVAGHTFKKDTDLHASFAYLWKNKEACNYRDKSAVCVNGQMMEGNEPKGACPKCEARKLVGPGTVFNVQPNQNGASSPPVGFVSPPVEILDYHVSELERLEQSIFRNLTGIDRSISNKEAKNQDQVKSELSSRYAKVMYWAENLEAVHKFLLETDLKLRFGQGFVSSTVSYGREFYLVGLADAIEDYTNAKASLPIYLLEYKRKVIEGLMTKNNDEEKSKIAIKRMIEPYPDLPLNQVPAETVEYEVKANFSLYFERFEAENGSVATFGESLSFINKIQTIKNAIYTYGRETIDSQRAVRQLGQAEGAPTTRGN